MGLLDNIIGRSPFLKGTQGMFNPQQPQAPIQFGMPQIPPQAPPQQQQGQGGGMDLGMIMKIMSMFGGGA